MSQKNRDNDPAIRIAESNASTLRVQAGPGTGKTRALKFRVARLLREDVPPERILATTFTRIAAGDLKRELENMNVRGASSVHATTIHSLCFSILSKQNVLEFSGRVPRPLLEFEKDFLLEDLKQAGVGNITDLKQLLRDFSAAWARDQKDKPGWPDRDIDKRFERHLIAWLKFHGAMLLEELVPEALGYLRANPESLERSQYKHVLVDEYQDLNVAEQEFIRLISKRADVTIIGDEDQSIYSFKHAHPDGIKNFHCKHNDTEDEKLDVCWRCPENIVDMANSLISYNESRSNRSLVPNDESPDAVVDAVQWKTMRKEIDGIASFTRAMIRNDIVKPGRILILAPIKELGYEIRDALNAIAVQAHSFYKEEELDQNPRKVEDNRILEAFILLQLIANPEDRVALRSWCGLGSPSLRSGSWRRVVDLCASNDKPLANVLEEIRTGEIKLKHDHKSGFLQRVRDLRVRLDKVSELEGKALFDSLFPQNDPYFKNIRDVVSDEIEEGEDAEMLLERLRNTITQPELPTDVDFVRVMSLHKSKGLTADLVVVLGCIQGLIPYFSNYSCESERLKKWEEQRRLFYVAITRAKKHLVLSSNTKLPAYLTHKINYKPYIGGTRFSARASDFLTELGPRCPEVQTESDFRMKYSI